MKILARYIVSEFAKLLAITLASFILLFIMMDVFENMGNLVKYNVPALPGAAFFVYKIPFIVSQVSPIAVLMATLLSLGMLAKSGEVTAIKAGGVRLVRVAYPLFVAGLLISAAIFIMNETMTPGAMKKTDAFRKQWFGYQGSSFGKEGIWLRAEGGIFNIRQFDTRKNRLNGITWYVMEKPFRVKSRVHAKTAQWKEGGWVAPEAVVWSFSATEEAGKAAAADLALSGLPGPEDLSDVENIHKNMGFMDLWNYIRGLEAEGYDASRYRIDLYGKVTFPLVNFIMVLVGIPFALKTGRHAGIAAGVGLSVAIAFCYWIVFAVLRSLGQSGMVPPIMAAALPDLLFLAIGALMFGYVRQ